MTGIFSYLLHLQRNSLTLYFHALLSLSGLNHKWPPFPAVTAAEHSSTYNNNTTTVTKCGVTLKQNFSSFYSHM